MNTKLLGEFDHDPEAPCRLSLISTPQTRPPRAPLSQHNYENWTIFGRSMAVVLLIIFTFSLSACGGGGGGGNGEPNTTTGTAGDVSGKWFVTELSKSHDCQLDPGLKNFSFTVSQNGNSLTVVDDSGNSYSANLSGAGFSWTGSYDEKAPDGTLGNTSLNPMSVTVDATCDNITGSANWTWSALDGSGYSCSGSTNFSGNRSPAVGCGSPVTDPTDSEAPTIPSFFKGAATSPSEINLKWGVSTDNVEVEGYNIYRNGQFLSNILGNGTSIEIDAAVYDDSGLAASTEYCYAVSAYDTSGNESAKTVEICIVTYPPSTDSQAPTTPGNLSAVAASSSQINLSWSASTDNVAVTAYNVYRNNSFLQSVPATSTSDTNLTASTNYCYSVLAKDAAGNSSVQTSNVCTSTQTPAITTPNAPSNLLALNVTHNSATISWTDNANNETGFQIGTCSGLVSSNIFGTSCVGSGFQQVTTAPSGQNQYTFSNLLASKQYKYYVRAYNSAGVSQNYEVQFTTGAAPTTSTLTIKNNLSGSGSVNVLQLRVASTVELSKSDSNELLSPDNTCVFAGPKSISPAQTKTYSISNSLASTGYSVFIGLGIPDNSFCSSSGYFEKKMWYWNPSFTATYYLVQIFVLPASYTNASDVEIRLGYSGINQNLVGEIYQNGIYKDTLAIVVVTTDLTTP